MPAPRRSVRSRKQPSWMASEDYVMSHQLSSADGMKSAECTQQKLDTDSLVQILPWKVTAIIRILPEKDLQIKTTLYMYFKIFQQCLYILSYSLHVFGNDGDIILSHERYICGWLSCVCVTAQQNWDAMAVTNMLLELNRLTHKVQRSAINNEMDNVKDKTIQTAKLTLCLWTPRSPQVTHHL